MNKFLLMLYIVLIPSCVILFTIFIKGMIDLYKKENENGKRSTKDGIEGYIENEFGIGKGEIYRTLYDEIEGQLRYIVYIPHYEWFKTPKYDWYEVLETEKGYIKVELAEYPL